MLSEIVGTAAAAPPGPEAGFQHGVSLLGGWLPRTVEVLAVAALVVAIGWRSRRWRLVWLPLAVLGAAIVALLVWHYIRTNGLSSDPPPRALWIWTGLAALAVLVFGLGWRGARWWRRGVALLAVPLCLAALALVFNEWVGYYPTVAAAWSAATAGPLPDEVDADELPTLRGTAPAAGKVVGVDIPDTASGFAHRKEYVYLPPAWFTGSTPPQLPVVMMIAGEFNTPADWMRSGNIIPAVDAYAGSHGGQAPILVFVDAGGRFNNDTECVDGPRGAAADHLTEDVRPFVVSRFGASSSPAQWGVTGWSMGGTCAIDLTVMHPDLFSAFVDIAGDAAPTAGSKEQTIDRLFGGDAAAYDRYDPTTVMHAHGPYTGVAGLFEDLTPPQRGGNGPHPPRNGQGQKPSGSAPNGFGGRDDTHDTGETGAAEQLCAVATTVSIKCTVQTSSGGHSWQFAERSFTMALPWLAERLSGQPTTP